MARLLNKHDRLREILQKFDGVVVSFLMRDRWVVEGKGGVRVELLNDFIH